MIISKERLTKDWVALRNRAKTPFEVDSAELMGQLFGLITALQLQMRVLAQTPVDR